MTTEVAKVETISSNNGSSVATRPARVVIVGSGFGGLRVIKQLASQPEVQVTVLDRNNYHGFWPLLYQIASAALESDSVAFPIREVIQRDSNINFQLAEVESVDLVGKQVQTDTGPLAYDYLVLAAGSANNYFGSQSIPQHTFSLKDIDQALEIRRHLLHVLEAASAETDPQRRKTLLTFMVVGAGPTGVELCGAFADLLQPLIRKEFPTLKESQVRIVLVEAHDSLLAEFPPPLQQRATQHLERMGIEILHNSKVTEVEGETVKFEDGRTMSASTVVWSAGVKASELSETLKIKLASKGTVPITPQLHMPDHPEVFVIGDMAYLEGYKQSRNAKPKPYPMVAEVAMQQGRLAGRNILAAVRHQPLAEFKYLDLGTMSTIGRKDAVATVFGLNLSGLFAWLAWLLVHLFFLIGFRNRFLVMLSWAYDYITYNRGVRLLGGKRLHNSEKYNSEK